jgi:hypothetical protein
MQSPATSGANILDDLASANIELPANNRRIKLPMSDDENDDVCCPSFFLTPLLNAPLVIFSSFVLKIRPCYQPCHFLLMMHLLYHCQGVKII